MKKYKRIVIKIGTKVITSKDRGLDAERVDEIAYQVEAAMTRGIDVILVTSGAIGAGMQVLKMKKRPADIASLQAAAAVGQYHMMYLYGEFLKKRQYNVGQILLTQEDFNDRKRYLNIKHTINALLTHKIIPVINENDTVATEEIKCGDNDRLSSLVADLCEADLLILLTDVDGLLDGTGTLVREVPEVTAQVLKMGGKSHCDLGTGGMATKLEAAKNVTAAGIDCIIANGKERHIITRIVAGETFGTRFMGKGDKSLAKKRWIAYSSRPKGTVSIDDGATVAILEKNKSLLASGIAEVAGNFRSGDVISISDKKGVEIARGVANYSAHDLAKIKGLKTSSFRSILGSEGPDEVIHKDNLVII
ncbi:MAG: glutamate 5-kinase [Candidatus Omnitrophica bacterium]|nr:glutamate 5-kinase [Candidatus Omnitrophota bacterium]